MVLSFTAPAVTPEFEQKERESQTEEQLTTIRNEIYGEYGTLVETEQMRNNASSLLAEALDSIPNTQKYEYLEACERDPGLVERESNSVAFMRSEQYNPWVSPMRQTTNRSYMC